MAYPPVSHNIESQRLGHREHKRIFRTLAEQAGTLLSGLTAPDGPLNIDDLSCNNEVEVKTKIAEDLELSARVDVLIGGSTCVEIKPSRLGRHALQLMYETMAIKEKTNDPHGILYVYNKESSDEMFDLRDCGRNYWEDGKSLAVLARGILDIQKKLDDSSRLKQLFKGKKQIITEDKGKVLLEPWKIQELSNEAISLRHDFDNIAIPLISELANSLEQY